MKMPTNKDLAADVVDANGPFGQWLERERRVYLAHYGRDGTREGFQQHVAKMMDANPKMREQMIAEFADAIIDATE